MEEKLRFDGWNPLIPKVGQVIQVRFTKLIFEVEVKGRFTEDGETFKIDVSNVCGLLVLVITPKASAGGMVDRANDLKPYWRVDPCCGFPSVHGELVTIFFRE
jgi:hypothetical protein